MHACHTGACQQGRLHCPTPDACEVDDESQELTRLQSLSLWAGIIVFCLLGALAVGAQWANFLY